MADYYTTLGVAKTATAEEIKRAYRKLASQHHPDKGGDTAKFQQVEEAYRTLGDPDKRAAYDNPAPAGHHFNFDFGPGGVDDIFGQFFRGASPFAHARQQPRRNKDIRAAINIGLQETLVDQNKTIGLTANGINQTVDLVVPRGVTNGSVIKFAGLGDHMFENLPRGDLYITVNVFHNPNYEVSGLDLVTLLTIDAIDAILGCTRQVLGLDGKLFEIKIPAGCQPNTKLKIPGQGLYKYQTDARGNLYVKLNITIPKNLTPEQLDAVQSIRQQIPT